MVDQLGLPKRGIRLFTPGGIELSWRSVLRRSGRVATVLESAGVASGSVVISAAPNGPEFLVALMAAWRVNAVFAPVSPSTGSRELERLLSIARPRVVLFQRDSRVGRFLSSRSEVPISEDDDSELCLLRLPDQEEQPEEPTPDERDALLLFTSGSTGSPKGVLLTHRNVLSGVQAVIDRFGLRPEDRSVALLPWTHGHGLIGQLLSSLVSGASLIVPSTSNLVESGIFSRETPPTWLTMVPSQVAVICDSAPALADSLPELRFIRTASAPLKSDLACRAETVFACPVAEAYGMTETSHQAAANPPDLSLRRIGTVGLPTGVRIRLSPSGRQELEVQGDSVFRGYVGQRRLTEDALSSDGWYRTGDIGEIAPDGRLRLLGRLTELINCGGYKVSPAEVEEAVASHSAVLDCIATAVDSPILGEEVAVLVVPRKDAHLTVAELKAHYRELLTPYKHPSQLHFVDTLPRLSSGKPDRRLAKRIVQSRRAAG